MDRIKLGKAAEYIFVARCLLQGFECFLPVSGGTKVDVVVGTKLLRCQVKAITDNVGDSGRCAGISLRKVGCNSKTNTKISFYTAADVEFMVGVDVEKFDVYIVPIAEIKNRRFLSMGMMTKGGFKNAFGKFGEPLV